MNTPKHVFMQRALGHAPPVYAHLPLVFNIDGTKMSKRDKHRAARDGVKARLKSGAWTKEQAAVIAQCAPAAFDAWLDKADTELDMAQVARLAAAAGIEIPEIDVHDFRLAGYLPEALVNFIALIGWSPGDNREKLSMDELVECFSLERIIKTPGRFDREKLLSVNTDWAATLPADRLLAAFKDWAAADSSPLAALDDLTAARVLEVCRGFRTFRDVEHKAGILFAPDETVAYDPDAVKKVLEKKDGHGYATLEALLPELERLDPWTAEAVDVLIKRFCETRQVKMGDVAQPLRVAVAGRPVSPAIGETLALLGRGRTLNRVRRCIGLRAIAG